MNEPALRSLAFHTDVAIRQIEGSQLSRGDGYWRIETSNNPTFYWGNFLLFDELGDVQSMLDTFSAELPNAKHVALGIDDPGLGPESLREFSELGFEVESNAVLTAPTKQILEIPESTATLKLINSDLEWSRYVEVGMSVRPEIYEEMAYQKYLEEGVANKRSAQARGRAQWLGAYVDGILVSSLGIYDCGRGVSRYQKIETHPDFRRQGFASQLIRKAAEVAHANFAAKQLVIVADPNDYAISLYRKLGFIDTESQIQIQKQPG